MATIRQSLELQDNVSNRLNRMVQAADGLIGRFGRLDDVIDNFEMSDGFVQADESARRLGETLGGVSGGIDDVNDNIGKMSGGFGKLGGVVKTALAAFSVAKIKSFVDEVFKLNNTQIQVEVQLATVLNNQGQSMSAFNDLRKRASELQGQTMFGDEALIAGAAELSTYISDSAAISSMMGTLSNYAAGMSGGGAVDTAAMTEYATQLGKALDGTYDGLKKKGFELSDAQKAIIENGSDMEKALVLDEVINQSWENLAKNMRKTPTGMITALNNTIGDIGETIGAKLTLKFMELAEMAYQFITSSGAQEFLDDIVNVLNVVFDVLEWGLGILQVAIDHWETVKIVLIGAAAAFLTYQLSVNGASIALGIAKGAQTLFNLALNACPIFWVVAGVTALCAALSLYTDSVNKSYGLTLSFGGMLGGSLMTILAGLGNFVIEIANRFIGSFDFMWNTVADFMNFFANVSNNTVGAVWNLWEGLFRNLTDLLLNVTQMIDKTFNTKLSDVVVGYRDKMIGMVKNKYGDEMSKASETVMKKKSSTLEYIDVNEAFDAGYYVGDKIANKTASNSSAFAFDYESIMNGPSGTADDPLHTNVDNDVNIAEEDLQLMRDVAEARYVQNFVTLTPTVQVSGNTINEKADISDLVDEIEKRLDNEIAASAEGVYA